MRPGRRALALTSAIAAAVAIAMVLLSDDDEPDAVAAPSAPLAGCRDRIEGGNPRYNPARDPQNVTIGPVSFSGLARAASRRAFETYRTREGYGVKAAASVRAGETVTIAIAAPDRGRVRIQYPNEQTRGDPPAAAARLAACSADEPSFSGRGTVGSTTGFAGGFTLDRPTCATIEVYVEGRAEPLRRTVSFGAGRCP